MPGGGTQGEGANYRAGIDAGGTGVRVRVVAADGSAVWEGEAPSAPDGGPAPALALLRASEKPLGAVAAGIAKITRPGVEAAWRTALARAYPGATLAVVPDFEIAFWAAVPGGVGVAVLAGTGSVAFGRSAGGETARVGGRGWEYGDEGSGTFLTEALLRRTVRALDGLSELSPLQRAVCASLSASEAGALVLAAQAACEARGRGFLVPLVRERAEVGDAEARDLFVGAAGWLAALGATALGRLGFAPDAAPPVVGIGGLWNAGERLTEPFAAVLHRRYPNALVLRSSTPPLDGAVRLAWGDLV